MKAEFVTHGGRIAEACRSFGGVPADWLDLSTGINPQGWPGVSVLHPDWRNLPDPDALARLEGAAARHFGIDPAHCCAVPGTEAAIRLLGRLLALPSRTLTPTYRTHAEAFTPSAPITFGTTPDRPSVCVVANPNNPDGILRSPCSLIEWKDRITRDGGWLIVDEAFGDCTPQASVASAVANDQRLMVLRSFGKFFGLAGVRLGFLLGPQAILDEVRRALGDWSIHAGALVIGTAAYRDENWITATRSILAQRAAAMDAVLAAHTLQPRGACPLFRLVETERARALFRQLARARILVRPFAEDPSHIRLGVPGNSTDLARLDRALAHG